MPATLEAYRCPQQADRHPAQAEMLVLCLCAQATLTEEAAERLRELVQRPLDWPLLLQVARRHRTLPLLHRHLQAHCPHTVPAGQMQTMHEECQEIAFRNLTLSADLIKLVKCLQKEGIDSIPYKGPILTKLAYGDLALRQFDDLDILVRTKDVRRAKEVILANGFQSCGYESLARFFTENSCHLLLAHPQHEFIVELHWAIAPSYFPLALKQERLWQHLRQIPFGGIAVLAHAPEDLFLILCVHGTKHHWKRLAWVADLAELIRRNPGMQWSWLIAEAGRLRCKRLVLLGIWLAVEVLGAPVPNLVSDELAKDPVVAKLGAEVWEGIAKKKEISWAGFKNVAFTCRVRESIRDRIVYVARRLFTPTQAEWSLQALPKPLHFLYFPLRALRLTAEHGGSMVKRAVLGGKK